MMNCNNNSQLKVKRGRGRPPKSKQTTGNQTTFASSRSYSDDLKSIEVLLSKLRDRNIEDVQFLRNVKAMLYKMYDIQSVLDEQFSMVRESVFNEFSNAPISYEEVNGNHCQCNQQFNQMNNSQQMNHIENIYTDRGLEFSQQDRTVFQGYNCSQNCSQDSFGLFDLVNSQSDFDDGNPFGNPDSQDDEFIFQHY